MNTNNDTISNPGRRINRRRPMLLVGAGFTAALLASCTTDTDHVPPSAAQVSTTKAEVQGPMLPEKGGASVMPVDLQEMLRSVNSPDAPTEKLINMPYKEVKTFTLGNRNVRIVQAGGELSTGSMTEEQIGQLQHNLELFDAFAHNNTGFVAPITEGDVNYSVVSQKDVKFRIEPQDKPVVIFAVPTSVDLGVFGAEGGPQGPNVFTDTKGPVNISIIRPDYPDDSGNIVEACQATTNVVMDDPSLFEGVAPDVLTKLNTLGQESFCNALGEAITAGRYVGFEEYRTRVGKAGIGGTEQPQPGRNAFFMTMPYVDNAVAFPMLDTTIPADIGSSFVFPQATI